MKVKVDQKKCCGCGACVALDNTVFDFNDDGLAYAINEEIPKDKEKVAKEAISNCPLNAICEIK